MLFTMLLFICFAFVFCWILVTFVFYLFVFDCLMFVGLVCINLVWFIFDIGVLVALLALRCYFGCFTWITIVVKLF